MHGVLPLPPPPPSRLVTDKPFSLSTGEASLLNTLSVWKEGASPIFPPWGSGYVGGPGRLKISFPSSRATRTHIFLCPCMGVFVRDLHEYAGSVFDACTYDDGAYAEKNYMLLPHSIVNSNI